MEYLVKPSFGKVYHFCYNSQGLCYCTMVNENLTEYKVLNPNSTEDFDVAVDNNDNLHVVCKNENGDISYFTNYNNNWEEMTVLQTKTNSNKAKCLKLFRVNNWLNLIYILEYKGNTILAHQVIGQESMTPIAIDYMEGEFSAANDSFGNIYILYKSATKDALGYIIYSWSQKKWGEFNVVCKECDVKSPYIFIDKKNNIHISGVMDDEIIDFSRTMQGFGAGVEPIFIEKDNLYLVWKNPKTGKILCACSTDMGETFLNATEFMNGQYTSAKKYSIAYNNYENEINANNCYGYMLENSIKLYLLQSLLYISKIPPKPLRPSIEEEAKSYFNEYNLNSSDDNIELTKLGIKINDIINGLDKINKRLDIIEKNMQTLK